MRQFLLGLSFSAVFAIGCVAGAIGAAGRPAEANHSNTNATHGPAVAAWEYECVFPGLKTAARGLESGLQWEEVLNERGKVGWELAAYHYGDPDFLCFRRMISPGA